MKEETERIIQADESAASVVDDALAEAERIRREALSEAEALRGEARKKLDAVKRDQEDRVLSEARSKAKRIGGETDRYIEQAELKRKERMDALVETLLREALRT